MGRIIKMRRKIGASAGKKQSGEAQVRVLCSECAVFYIEPSISIFFCDNFKRLNFLQLEKIWNRGKSPS